MMMMMMMMMMMNEIQEKNSRKHLDGLQNKSTNCKGVKNNTNFGQITRINTREAGYNM